MKNWQINNPEIGSYARAAKTSSVASTPTQAVRRDHSTTRTSWIRPTCLTGFTRKAANMVNANLVALLALPILAAILAIYLLRVGDNVGHLFILMGAGFCVIAMLPYVFNTPSDIGAILLILGLGCVAWGLTLRKRRFRWKKHRS
ncbi:MAG: hypothetical protein WCB79_09560 [Halobacteriota archaeon]